MSNIGLTAFCSKNPTRDYITRPWVYNRMEYATDGAIIVRVGSDKSDTVGNTPERKHVEGMFCKESYHDAKWYKLPGLPSGSKPCTLEGCHCGGKGTLLTPMTPIRIGCASYSDRYLRMIADLPGCVIQPLPTPNPARFMFEGGEGLLMPLEPQ
jgi:hypothetical protein